MFVLNPAAPRGGTEALRALRPGERANALALSAGSGCAPLQVVSRLTDAHTKPIAGVALNASESALVSHDEAGRVVVWRYKPATRPPPPPSSTPAAQHTASRVSDAASSAARRK